MKKKITAILIVLIFLVLVFGIWYFMKNDEVTSKMISENELNSLIEDKGADITWKDLSNYSYEDIGSGLYVYSFPVSNGSRLIVLAKTLDEEPWGITLIDVDGIETVIKPTE